MSALVPDESPFQSREFARFWEGWRGRKCCELEVDGFSFPYVQRRLGPLRTCAALPFGIPLFVNDRKPEQSRWAEAFFGLSMCYHSSLSMYEKPEGDYPGVRWTAQERSVVQLTEKWESHVRPETRRQSRRAADAGWAVRDLTPEEIPSARQAIAETARRHDEERRFDEAFYARLLRLVSEPGRVRLLGVVRNGEIGGFQVIFRSGQYETGWQQCTTAAARETFAGPLLIMEWLRRSAANGIEHVDFGVSPNAGVRTFKESFGAQSAPLYSGMRRWHLWGK